MTTGPSIATEELLGKARLSVTEMTSLIAAMIADLPTVRSVVVDGQENEISVDLKTGKRIGFTAIPVAQAMNESMDSRRQALDEFMKRCA